MSLQKYSYPKNNSGYPIFNIPEEIKKAGKNRKTSSLKFLKLHLKDLIKKYRRL